MRKYLLMTIAISLFLTAFYVQVGTSSLTTSNSIYVNETLQHTASQTAQVTISSNPIGSGFVVVDGISIVTPHTFAWNVGENHTLFANEILIEISNQHRYRFSEWSDGGAYSHTYTVSTSPAQIVADYRSQYYLAVINGINETGSGWYDEGTLATASSSVMDSSKTLLNYQLDGSTQKLADNFALDSQYNLSSMSTSPNGLWLDEFIGNGAGVKSCDNGINVFFLQPARSTYSMETHAVLVGSSVSYSNFTVSVDVNTYGQLRENDLPNTWETAWIFFRYTNTSNYYWFTLRTNGYELGKKEGSLTQIFLVTKTGTPKANIGEWSNWQITGIGNNIKVWIDGVQIIYYTDTSMDIKLASGAVCLYCEDSLVYWSNVSIRTIPQSSPTNLQNPIIPKTGIFTTQGVLMNTNHVINFITSPVT
jgi:hypothetical protein